MTADVEKKNLIVSFLSIISLVALITAYFLPIWWVSLTAPQYPAEAFPDGIRIHFHFNGVSNGCSVNTKPGNLQSETLQHDLGEDTERYNPILDRDKNINEGAKGLDCVHEMNTINHYVGMFPIETGAPVERPLAKFFFAFFAAMIIAFIIPKRKTRVIVLALGFFAVAVWMVNDQFIIGNLDKHVANYVKEAGAFFNEPEKLEVWGKNVHLISVAVISGLIVVMLFMIAATAIFPGFTLLLPLVPALLPIFFVITYAAWLWFFGHNLHPWAAFSVKPFMPTVLGEGMVAQFTTRSYPYYGYYLLIFSSCCLILALLLRRQAMKHDRTM